VVVAIPRLGRAPDKHGARRGSIHLPPAAAAPQVICDRYLSTVGDDVMVGLGAIVVLGVGMQWIARRFRLPAILLLIAAGLAAGPWLGIIRPDEIFGDSLFTLVSMAVSLLLFEGGLGLDVVELRRRGPRPVVQLVTIGVLITWVAVALVAVPLFGLSSDLAVLLGALLVVSGPTVVGPLLRLTRPREPTATILRWEGIVIDPIGATLALVVLKVVTAGDSPIAELALTALVGIGVGVGAAALLVLALRTFSVPDDLEPAVTFMMVIGAYVVGEWAFEEAGLFAATALGIALANQPWVSVRRIAAFGHDVGVLVLGGLFVVLAARVTPDDFTGVIAPSIVLVLVLVLVVRPVVGWVCTMGSDLPAADRALIGAIAPRGIVAAATSALFALRLDDAGLDDGRIEAIVFTVIVGTCLIYGLAAPPLARRLKVAEPEPRGILLVGHQPWLLALADLLSELGESVTVLASGQTQLDASPHAWRLLTVPVLDRAVSDVLDSTRTAVLASHDDEHNALALSRCLDALARKEILLLPGEDGTHHRPGRRAADALAASSTDADAGDAPDLVDPLGPVDDFEQIEELEAEIQAAPARGWERRPFAPGTTQRSLAAAYEAGGLRVVTVPDAAAGELVLAIWGDDGILDLAPTPRARRAATAMVVAGGRLGP
jgi:NhaP-type Na+/H+ or K+/H+ antiporter